MDLVLLLLVISVVPYVLVGLVIAIYGRKQRLRKDYSYHPTVTIFLPTCDEEKYVARKLENLLEQTYPIEDILVYDCSVDSTRRIVEEYQKVHSNIYLIRQEQRVGMARTLNEALKTARGELIVKTDCDSLTVSNDALRELVANFAHKSVGGASGVCVNKGLEGSFRSFMTRLQIAESNLDSTIVAHATSLLAFRKSAVVQVDPGSLADDTEEFVLIRKKGWRTIIDSNVVSVEEVPESFADRRIQKDRRAEGVILVLLQNLSALFNYRYGLYGFLVFPINLFLLAISPYLIMLDLMLVGYYLFLVGPIYLVAYAVLLLSPVFFYKVRVTRPNALLALIDLQLSGLMGTLRLSLGRRDAKWKRIR